MKVNSKKTNQTKAQLELEREKQAREQYLSSLSKEERIEFLKHEEEQKRKNREALAKLFLFPSIFGGPYK